MNVQLSLEETYTDIIPVPVSQPPETAIHVWLRLSLQAREAQGSAAMNLQLSLQETYVRH
jgi:hypothetical protein